MTTNNNQVQPLKNNSNKIFSWIALLFRPHQTIRELLETETAESAWNLWVTFTVVLAVITPLIAYLQTILLGEPNLYFKEWLLGITVLAIINLLMFYIGSYFFLEN